MNAIASLIEFCGGSPLATAVWAVCVIIAAILVVKLIVQMVRNG